MPWWQEMVLYENHLPSLRDGNGDGIGDLEGLIASLDYLAGTLGVTAVWVGPFFRSPLRDQGFDVTDHTDVDPVFGDLATFDQLVAEAHARNIRVVVDYVPNHTSDQHPWFTESRSSRDNPKRDWYVWADAAPGQRYPNNWLSEVTGSSWEWDERTGQFYLHSHLKDQPDLNWRNPQVRAAQLDVLRFWLDRGADGFRIDVAHMLMKDPELRDNPPNPHPAVNPYELQPLEFFTQLHVNDRMHPDVHGVLREIRAVLDEYDGDRVAVGEIEAMDWAQWTMFYGPSLEELQLPFAFQLIETPWRAPDLAAALAGLDATLPAGAWPCLALGNHDRRRLATRLGRPQARVAAMLLLTLRGVPTILYGDELGLADQDVPADRQRDSFALCGGVSHDPTRTPMPWTSGRNGGFSTADASALWLPACREYETINVETQLADAGSSLNLYRRLLALRAQSEALRLGDYRQHPATDQRCLVYTRTTAGDRKLIALNLTPEACALQVPEQGTVILSTRLGRAGERCTGTLLLAPDEGVVIDTRVAAFPPGEAARQPRRRELASRRQQVVDLLRDEIITGQRQPGQQLKQDALCADFGLSPAPVREALRQLETEGLVTHRPNRGAFVTEITPDDLLGLLLPVRLAIESHAVPVAATQLEPSELTALEEIVDAMRSSAAKGDLMLLNELDVRFHDLTVQASGSAQAIQLWRSVQPRIRAQIYRLAPRHADLQEIVLEHAVLLDAIRSADPGSIRRLLEDHIVGSNRTLLVTHRRKRSWS